MSEEIWKPVYGYGGKYEVSNFGRIFTKHQNALKKQRRCPMGGYLRVDLFRKNKRRTVWVHRLVARAFLGPCPKGYEVHHTDFNRTHNSLSNLEYMTVAENGILHGESTGVDSLYLRWLYDAPFTDEYSPTFEEWKAQLALELAGVPF